MNFLAFHNGICIGALRRDAGAVLDGLGGHPRGGPHKALGDGAEMAGGNHSKLLPSLNGDAEVKTGITDWGRERGREGIITQWILVGRCFDLPNK